MRTRLLRPGFFENELLASLPAHGRLLFAGLWLMADRAGRLKDRPAVIRATLFPYEPDVDVNGLLAALAAADFIIRYNGAVQITNFGAHQHPHHREPETRIPQPPETTKIRRENAKPRKSRGKARAKPRLSRVDTYAYTNTDVDTRAAALPEAEPGAIFDRYVILAAEALRQTLLDHHSDNIGLVTERFKELCLEQEHVCEAELAAQAVEAALEARARKASQLLELMRKPARRA